MGDRITQMIDIQSKALNLFKKKNGDYGDAFAKHGVIGVLIRIQDKIQRALSITSNNINLVDDESMSDTMIDLHNYAAMALMLMEEGRSDNYLDTTSGSDRDSQSVDFLDLDEVEYQEYKNDDFNPYISIPYSYQLNEVEYDNKRDEETYQEV